MTKRLRIIADPCTLADYFYQWTDLWHRELLAHIDQDSVQLVIAYKLHGDNYSIWHLEDRIRRKDLPLSEILHLKRAIDERNQKRNDRIGKLDQRILGELQQAGVSMPPDARPYSESPAQIIDRLSVLALRIYHLEAESMRSRIGSKHNATCETKLSASRKKKNFLLEAANNLMFDIEEGKGRFLPEIANKLYNDPETNPELYKHKKPALK